MFMAREGRSIPFRTGKRKPSAAMVLCLKARESSSMPGLFTLLINAHNQKIEEIKGKKIPVLIQSIKHIYICLLFINKSLMDQFTA